MGRKSNKPPWMTRSNKVRIPFSSEIALSTLADETAIFISVLGNLSEDIYLTGAKTQVTVRDLSAGEIPLQLAWAHGDYTLAEVKEALDASPAGPQDKIAIERAKRAVRNFGVIQVASNLDQFNLGSPKYRRLQFTVEDGEPINFVVMNRSGGALTTGATVEIQGDLFGYWRV